jgi:hypothetical protein
MPPTSLRELESKRAQLKATLSQIDDMRPGSLVERYRKCGKPTCRCAKAHALGHGPQWVLTREMSGKTVTKTIPGAALEQTRKQVAEYRRFKDLSQELIEISEQVCEARGKQSPVELKKNTGRKLTR